jgi:hypothetical protein
MVGGCLPFLAEGRRSDIPSAGRPLILAGNGTLLSIAAKFLTFPEHYLIGWKATDFETLHGDQAVKRWRMLNLFGRGKLKQIPHWLEGN